LEHKEAYLRYKKEDVVIIDSPVGLPGKAILNEFLERVCSGVRETFKCPWKCLISCDSKNVPYCIGRALTSGKKDKLDEGFAFAGATAHRAGKIISAEELVETLVGEYMTAGIERSAAA
jgi:NAD(P)H-dependent flavin oxidoreductase YrpB (nitropropane dioxygenase family)